jgi:hypothetical protein
MKTKELIKLLQDADPKGESYIRSGGGAINGVQVKEGYWDGPYSYLDKNGTYITSTKGYKIDLCVTELDDIVWECNGDMKEIKKKVKFDLTYCNDDREKEYWKQIEKDAEDARRFNEKSIQRCSFDVIKKMTEGWEVIQPLDVKIGMYNVMKYKKGLKKEQLNQGSCHAILKSGLFEPIKDKKYYIWKLKNK